MFDAAIVFAGCLRPSIYDQVTAWAATWFRLIDNWASGVAYDVKKNQLIRFICSSFESENRNKRDWISYYGHICMIKFAQPERVSFS